MNDPESSDFLKTVEEIKASEERADRMKAEAQAKAEQILKKARESVQKIKAETEEEVVKLKNKKLQGGNEKIDAEAQKLIDKAGDEADSLKKKEAGKAELSSMLKNAVLKGD